VCAGIPVLSSARRVTPAVAAGDDARRPRAADARDPPGVYPSAPLEGNEVTELDTASLIIRLVVGLTIVAHGYNHVFGPGGIQGTAGWFSSMGLRPGIVHAWTSGLLEIAAGFGLAVGFLNALSAGAIIGIMIVAGITAHRPNGFFIFKPGQGYEYVLMISAVAAADAILGPGKASLDHALGIEMDGWLGGLLAVLLGVGGAILLLGTSWRPEKKKADVTS
jgi:putative oxidoreductase